MAQLTRLFTPGKIGTMEVKNRLVMAAMGTHSIDASGYLNQRTIDYHIVRARGGVGLIITQGMVVIPEARTPNSPPIFDDRFIAGLRELAQAVQAGGAKIVCQLTSGGVKLGHHWKDHDRPADIEVIGPSAVPCFSYKSLPRAISREEIARIVEAHAEAVRRARDAGFDAAEIHAAHGYFLSAFLSPFRNRRTDEYGGSVENRARFAREIITRTREKVGRSYPVLIRMNGSDFLEGGLTVEEACLQAAIFAEAGADAIDMSVATQDSRQWRDLTYLHPDAALVHLSAAIKKAVRIPVITVGKIGDPVLADRILEEGKADFVAMGRALLADPDLPNKAREDRLGDIQSCIYCNNCRIHLKPREREEARGTALTCTVNPALLREREFELQPAAKPKKVMVIGGGLAGMEAARVAAQRGHQVSLYEKSGELGGQWNIACKSPAKSHFATLSRRLIRQLGETGVKVTLNKEVTRQFVQEQRPDAVVVATGAVPATMDVPGASGRNVVQATDVLDGKAATGERVVVLGGRLRGMEVADYLAEQGKKVSLVTRNRLGGAERAERNVFVVLRERLAEHRVMLFPFTRVYEIRDNGVHVVNDDELMFLPADTVVLAVGAKAENRLVEELHGVVPELYAIGDCVEPRDAREATNQGAEVARMI